MLPWVIQAYQPAFSSALAIATTATLGLSEHTGIRFEPRIEADSAREGSDDVGAIVTGSQE